MELLKENGNYLIEAHDVAYVPSASYLIHERCMPKTGAKAIRLAVDKDGGPFAALKVASTCTKEVCLTHATEPASITILAAPADFAAQDPMLAMFQLQPEGVFDGSIYAAKLLGASLKSDSVWLVPTVASGDASNPDIWAAFDEGFLQGGARALIHPLGKLPAEVSAALLKAVISPSGVSLAALSKAKREALAAAPGNLAPAFIVLSGVAE